MGETKSIYYKNYRIRYIERHGEKWYVLKDVCKILNISATNHAANKTSWENLGRETIKDSTGRRQNTTLANAKGIKDAALSFKRDISEDFIKWINVTLLNEPAPVLNTLDTDPYSGPVECIKKSLFLGNNGKDDQVLISSVPSCDVAMLLKCVCTVLRGQGSSPDKIAKQTELILKHFNIPTVYDFVEDKAVNK